MIEVVTPITGEVIDALPPTEPNAIDRLFSRARTAQREWWALPAARRGEILHDISRRIAASADEIAELETRNTGKPLIDTRREVDRAAACFAYYAGWCDKVTGTTVPVPGDFHTYTLREPHGVVAAIIPWNVPFFFAAKKFAPALAFGNACLLKPAPETPLTAASLVDAIRDAGAPDGLGDIVHGGADVGAHLVSHPDADLVAFTGSHRTGRAVAAAAADRLVPSVLELGGKSPQLVFADADLDAALDGVLLGIFGASGQMCVAGSRLYVQREVYETFVDRLSQRVGALRVGDPRRDGVNVGPMITRAQRDKTMEMIAAGEREGAHVLAQADLPGDAELAGGFFAPPTVFDEVEPDMTIMREEVFGPVLAVAPFSDDEDALSQAHATGFGLAAGVWTSNIGRAHRLAAALDVGNVWVNSYRVLSDLVPFGGVGWSGYGRENAEEAVRLYTRVKSVWTALRPGVPGGYRL